MAEDLTLADIQMPFLEYRSRYQEPIASIWFERRQGEIVSGLLKAFSPWQVSLENVTWNQNAKNLGEAQLTFSAPSLFSTFNVGVGALTITTLNPDWSRAPILTSFYQAGLDALKRTTRQSFLFQQATLGFHLKPGAKPFRETVGRLVNAKQLGSEDAAFFGVSVYYNDHSFVIDGSASIADGVFVKLIRNFAPESSFEEIARVLYDDEEAALNRLGLKLR